MAELLFNAGEDVSQAVLGAVFGLLGLAEASHSADVSH
jgi:sulfite exporter TauE/SafE